VTLETGLAGQQAQLIVTDTGAGIPHDELSRIFERLWRGRGAAEVAGSGIGLAVVAELVRAHGGSVRATSTPSLGTRVVVTLPRADL
jgi:two-component system sensor histidine kinase BaeS